MKKAIILSMVFAMAMGAFPALAVTGINTGLTQDTTGGNAPVVRVKWEAYGAKVQGTDGAYPVTGYYRDQDETAGAQFVPSGKFEVNTKIAVCAIVTDPMDGLADVTDGKGGVYADVFYPEGIGLGTSHVALADQSGLGCGELMQEDRMTRLSKADGIALFCNNVRNNNANLPTFLDETNYGYSQLCSEEGELWKETAAVFCTTKDLSYEDPSGDYEVWAVAQDDDGLNGTLKNHFTYKPVTAFEADFSSITYGNVKLGTEKKVSGNTTFNTTDGLATIRNVGNVRMAISVLQDDMGFGKTNSNWNVSYKARVGSTAPWTSYIPETISGPLELDFDLSEADEIDFSILVNKFPPTHEGYSYTGNMTLTATQVDHLQCYN